MKKNNKNAFSRSPESAEPCAHHIEEEEEEKNSPQADNTSHQRGKLPSASQINLVTG